MTCIVGLVHKQKVTIGGDSAGVANYQVSIRKDPKVFLNGPFLIGCTSSFRMIQILQFSFNPPKIKGDLYGYMCSKFVDAARDAFEKKGFMQKASEGDDRGGSFLVGVNGRLFNIDVDFQVGEHLDGYAAIGCGDAYALGSMYATEGDKPKKRVKKALKAASKFSAGVHGPFVVMKAP